MGWRISPDMALQEDGSTRARRRPDLFACRAALVLGPAPPSRPSGIQDGSQPIDMSLAGGATRGWPIRSQIARWPVASSVILIQLSGIGASQGDLPRLAR